MPIEELDVVEEVLVEVAAAGERPRDRAQRVDREPGGEQDDGAEATACELLELSERA
jgi:hypothetical protein